MNIRYHTMIPVSGYSNFYKPVEQSIDKIYCFLQETQPLVNRIVFSGFSVFANPFAKPVVKDNHFATAYVTVPTTVKVFTVSFGLLSKLSVSLSQFNETSLNQ